VNYTFQSFNFRNRQGARPFYDLVANIAAEEFGHVELVSATINTMLTGATPVDGGQAPNASLAEVKGICDREDSGVQAEHPTGRPSASLSFLD
jgi:Mn-containing catalase